MKQGTDYVYVKVSLAVVDSVAGQWSKPVQVRLTEDYSGDWTLETRDAMDQSLRTLMREDRR